jgi:general secretion pathway protein G
MYRQVNRESDGDSRRNVKGFSLIELIVVLVILGLLATVVGPRVIGKIGQSKAAIAKVQVADLEGALDMFRLDVGRYPTSSEGLGALVQNPGIQNWSGPYLKKNTLPKDPWTREYQYRSPGEHGGDYDLWSSGAAGSAGGEGDNADITSW